MTAVIERNTQPIERGIMFSGRLVRAILEGRKTETRRLGGLARANDESFHQSRFRRLRGGKLAEFTFGPPDRDLAFWQTCPYGKPGDRLYVRETFAIENMGPDDYPQLVWAADRAACQFSSETSRSPTYYLASDYEPARWKPSIHMPKWAARIRLEITEVRCERLQALTDADALAEGVPEHAGGCGFKVGAGRCDGCEQLRGRFALLWDETATAGCDWNANPWVWVIRFRRVK